MIHHLFCHSIVCVPSSCEGTCNTSSDQPFPLPPPLRHHSHINV